MKVLDKETKDSDSNDNFVMVLLTADAWEKTTDLAKYLDCTEGEVLSASLEDFYSRVTGRSIEVIKN